MNLDHVRPGNRFFDHLNYPTSLLCVVKVSLDVPKVPRWRSPASEKLAPGNSLRGVVVLMGTGVGIRTKQGTDVSFCGVQHCFLAVLLLGEMGSPSGAPGLRVCSVLVLATPLFLGGVHRTVPSAAWALALLHVLDSGVLFTRVNSGLKTYMAFSLGHFP